MTDSSTYNRARLGIHSFVWSATTTEAILEILPKIVAHGYDGIEVPLLRPGSLDVERIREELAVLGLSCTASSALPAGMSLIDRANRQESVGWLASVVEEASRLGASILCGPFMTPIGEMRGRASTVEEWENGVAALQLLGDRTIESGVTIAFEPLNRFEGFVVNTIADSIRLIREVDRLNVRLLLDTFHMNIEESGIPAAIVEAGEYIAHFHLSENHRGSVGSGHIPWDAVFDGLSKSGYQGWLVVESFGSALPELAAAASIWRALAPSPDALAAESMAFLASRLGRDSEINGVSQL